MPNFDNKRQKHRWLYWPTRGVIAEVKTELLWTIKVIPAPTTIAMYPVSHANGNGKSVHTKKTSKDIFIYLFLFYVYIKNYTSQYKI